MESKVSILIACYNKEAFIDRLMESLVSQTWSVLQIIFIDDGSIDETLLKLKEWAPKLTQRGYEVIIESQENKGVYEALHTAFLLADGQYVCCVDCDDALHPQYVSAMAGFLERNPGYQWTVCDASIGRWLPEASEALRRTPIIEASALQNTHKLVEYWLLARISSSAARYMVRMDYAKKYCIYAPYGEIYTGTQEPQIVLPLLAAGGQLKYLQRELYYYYINNTSLTTKVHTSSEQMQRHLKGYHALIKRVLQTLCPDKGLMSYWETLTNFRYAKLLYQFYAKVPEQNSQLAAVADQLFTLAASLLPKSRAISEQQRTAGGAGLFVRAVENKLLDYQNATVRAPLKPFARIILYGGLGEKAAEILPYLMRSPLKPHVIWDRAAYEGQFHFDIATATPQLNTLTPSDLVLVAVKKAAAAEEINETLRQSQAGEIWFYYDILDYLASHYYPQL